MSFGKTHRKIMANNVEYYSFLYHTGDCSAEADDDTDTIGNTCGNEILLHTSIIQNCILEYIW